VGTGVYEFLVFALIIVLLYMTGLWPTVIRGLRELRGEHVEDEEPGAPQSRSHTPQPPTDLDMCFRMLGLSPSATMEEIEKAYRRKARIHHPDHGGDEDTMRALNEAYNMIKKNRGRKA